MDPVQIVIIFISLTITALIVVLGIQVYYILAELRIAMTKVNEMLDNGVKVSGAMSQTVEGASGLVNGIVTGLSFLSTFGKKRRHQDDE